MRETFCAMCFSFVDKMVYKVDPACAHGSEVNGNKHKIECRYCGKINRRITGLKVETTLGS